ncbi:hypothetical protein O7606_11130 [Micromonospora sp. WMMD882]|uniref:effector-associated constant component EACC1 n=1 Tax=Micromonospora sp. WMMD882 TaxID=3015151 RepID=UPI00248B2D84|nr:hypothetical protein [Micromonospora sp. WMMD882]WBB81857.1 hypothetical protein O7606_11130 [Micromonospora sp. WMMD882]
MDVRVTVDADDRQVESESLHQWLVESAELRGRVVPVESPPPPGALGPTLDAILVAVAPGSVATALATILVTWIRHRGGAVRIEIELPDGRRARLEADKVRTLTDAQLRGELGAVVAALQPPADPARPPADPARPPADPARAAGPGGGTSGSPAIDPPAGPAALPAAGRDTARVDG